MALIDSHGQHTPQISRRSLIAGAGLGGIAAAVHVPMARAEDSTEFALVRSRYADLLMGTDFDTDDPLIADGIANVSAKAAAARAELVTDPGRDRVFESQPFVTSGSIANTYGRLMDMARAYRMPGADGHQDETLLNEVLDGLDTTEQLIYRAGEDEFDNWWHWEIGGPVNLAGVLILLDGLVPKADLDRYTAAMDWFIGDPAWQFERYPDRTNLESSATNRVDLCRNAFLLGMVAESNDHMELAADRLSAAFGWATERERASGLYPDGSFLYQGTVPYTGSYGVDMMTGLARLLGLFAGTSWEITDPRVERIVDAVEAAFVPIVFDGQVMDGVRGRSIARSGTPAFSYGTSLAEAILRLAPTTDAAQQARWRNIVAGWLERGSAVVDPLAGASLPRISLFKELLGDPEVTPAPEPTGFRIFPTMARVVHRGDDWACMINVASDRVSVYDYQLGENYRGFHTAAGWTQLYTGADRAQFSDAFWPTIDLYGLPGTTIDTQELAPGAGGGSAGNTLAPNAWGGGVALDESTGAFGQHLHGVGSSMTAHQSWFCLPDRIVALGAGIVGGSGEPIITTIENRNLHADGTHALTVNGSTQPETQGWEETFAAGSWAHLDGVAGYVLLDDRCRLNARRAERTGSWREVNDAGSTDPITRRYLTLWLDHGEAEKPFEQVVDTHTPEPGFTKEGWWSQSTRTGYNGNHYLATSPNEAGSSRAIWRPEIPTAGRYEVSVWFPPFHNNPPTAPYTVTHAEGEDTVVLNQLEGASTWQSLGEYEFDAGRAVVRMEVDGSGFPKADAVRVTQVVDGPAAPNSSYAYAVLPGASAEATESAAGESSVAILANSSQVQAVSAEDGAVILANFFEAGSVRRLTADGPCAVGLSTATDPVRLAVSDPTATRDEVRVHVALGRATLASADDTVTVLKQGAEVTVTVDTSERDGGTHVVTLAR